MKNENSFVAKFVATYSARPEEAHTHEHETTYFHVKKEKTV